MRGITFALLVTFVGSHQYDLVPGFSDNKSYLYGYEGFLLIGVPGQGLAKSGLKLTCKVQISRVSQEDHMIKVLSPDVEEYNGIWPWDPFIKAPKLTQRIRQCFSELNIQFQYRRGHIGDLYAPETFPVFCANILRGILDLLHITIKKAQIAYTLQEAGIGGDCETRYIIQEDRKNNRAIIFRTKDLNNCMTKVVKNIGMAYIRPCPTCPVKARNIKGTVSFTHKLKNTDIGAVIVNVDSQQVYEFSPINEPSGTVLMKASQSLVLIDTKSNQNRVPESKLHNHGNLHYQFASDAPPMAIHLIKTDNPEPQMVEILQQIIPENRKGHVETPARFLELIELARVATRENLGSLWKQFADHSQYRCWLLRAIATAGTMDTFAFLKQRLQGEELNVLESAVTLIWAFHSTQTDALILKAAADLITSPGIRKCPVLRKCAYLAYGTMINRHCSAASLCPPEIFQPIHELALDAASKGHEEDMALALKAMGNAGEPGCIKHIVKFLPGFSHAADSWSERIHVYAVLALRKIARKESAKVQEIAFQLFMDRSLRPKVRMVACVVFFETKPALPLVTAMASCIQRETSLQVARFAYSHMKALTLGRIPQLDNLSTACNIAIKLLSPWLDKTNFRYSRVMHLDAYYPNYRAGAIGRVYLMNKPNTMFLSAVIAKIRGYYATSAMDIAEVSLQLQDLTDLLQTKDIPFAQYSTYQKLKKIGKLLLGWKQLPSEKPLVSANLRLFAEEIAFTTVDKDLIQKAMKFVTEPEGMQTMVKQMITLVQNGLAGEWSHPVVAGEIRQLVPTCVGFPLEFGLYSASLVHATAKVDGQISPRLTGDFSLKQLLGSSLQVSVDVNPSVHSHTVAVMGINTPYFQTGLEFHAKFHARAPMKYDARVDAKQKSFKLETAPFQQETELVAIRTNLFAVSRNVDTPESAKKSPVLPEAAGPDILDHHFKSSKGAFRANDITHYDVSEASYSYGLGEELHNRVVGQSYSRAFCVNSPTLCCKTCLSMKSYTAPFLGKTYLHKFVGKHEIKLAMEPVHTDAAITKIQLDVQAEPEAAPKMMQLVRPEKRGDDEALSDAEDLKATLKKLLTSEDVANGHGSHQSSSSSSSVSGRNRNTGGKRSGGHREDGSSESSSDSGSDSNGNSTSSSSENSFSEDQADPEIYHYMFKSAHEDLPKTFLGDSKQPALEATLRTTQDGNLLSRFHLLLYADLHSARPTVQVFLSNTTRSSRQKVCAHVSLFDSQQAKGYVKWGRDCQDYEVTAKVASGRFGDHSPAVQVKLQWPKIPSGVKATASRLSTFIPGLGYMLGFFQREQKNAPRQTSVVAAFTSPRSCNVVLKLPTACSMMEEKLYVPPPPLTVVDEIEIKLSFCTKVLFKDAMLMMIPQRKYTIYGTDLTLPLPISLSPHPPTSALQPHAWSFLSDVPSSILENLKGHCSVSQGSFTTFNKVSFNYTMSASCYHILAMDCSKDLKFLVMAKEAEESKDLIAVNIKLASHEINMYPSNARVKLRINGIETVVEDLPYASISGVYLLIRPMKDGLLLKAPEIGIDKLYYDGRTLKIQVPFQMTGQTCGICGRNDAEHRQEYKMPSGYVAKDAVSFAQSWILVEEPCAGACKLQRVHVNMGKRRGFESEISTCYSTEPVLRCIKGCSATRTTPVSVGFHCMPSGAAAAVLNSTYMQLEQTTEDFEYSVDAHEACACEQLQCAS